MYSILVGILFGAVIGYVGNLLLFRKMDDNRRSGQNVLKGVGVVFMLRYLLDGVCLSLYYLVTKDAYGLVAAALSITVAVKISLYFVYMRKGGRFD